MSQVIVDAEPEHRAAEHRSAIMSGAPLTFSMTYGHVPIALKSPLIGGTRSGISLDQRALRCAVRVTARCTHWHGGLAWMASKPSSGIRQRVGLVELERVVRLRIDVHADHLEPGPVVAHGRAAGAAEQVEQSRLHGRCPSRILYCAVT